MSDGEVQIQVTQMTISKGIGIYVALLMGMFILIKLAIALTWFSNAIPSVAYFTFGFIINRFVLRGLVEWHPVYNTLENVFSSKLQAFIFWPIVYPILFFKLGVAKHL